MTKTPATILGIVVGAAVGFGLDTVLGQLAPLLEPTTASPTR